MISRKVEIETRMKNSFVRSEKLILFHLHLEVLKSDTSSTIELLKNKRMSLNQQKNVLKDNFHVLYTFLVKRSQVSRTISILRYP